MSACEKVADLVMVGRIDHGFKPFEQELPSVFGNPDCGKVGPHPTGMDLHGAIVTREYPLRSPGRQLGLFPLASRAKESAGVMHHREGNQTFVSGLIHLIRKTHQTLVL